MAYIPSPMENFNKSNPFVIISKKEYDSILDDLHEFSTNAIKMLILNIPFVVILLSIIIYHVVIANSFTVIFQTVVWTVFIVIYNVWQFIILRKKLKHYLYTHPAMIEFDKISKLEVNEIIAIQMEDILQVLHKMYLLHGEIISETKNFIKNQIIIIIITGIILVLQFVSYIL